VQTPARPHTQPASPPGLGPSPLCSERAVWFVLLVAQILALVIALILGPQAFWTHLAMASLLCHWVGLAGLWSLCRLQTLGFHGGRRVHWLIYWLVLSALGWCGLIAGYSAYHWLFPETGHHTPGALLMQLGAILLFAGLLLRYWYLQDALTRRQQAATQARLDALQARLNPHFLFNSLNSVAALISQDAPRAEAAVEHLADLMRASLKSHQTLVPLYEEIRLTEAYIWLEQARFGERLKVIWDMDDALLFQSVPILSMQPLVENAVKHGIAHRTQGGQIEIRIKAAVKVWMLSVKNPLPDTPAESGNGTALKTLEARGESLLGRRFSLSTRQTPEHYIAQMTLIMDPEADGR